MFSFPSVALFTVAFSRIELLQLPPPLDSVNSDLVDSPLFVSGVTMDLTQKVDFHSPYISNGTLKTTSYTFQIIFSSLCVLFIDREHHQ